MSHNETVVQPNGAKPLTVPDPEVQPSLKRRTFTAKYKLRILEFTGAESYRFRERLQRQLQ